MTLVIGMLLSGCAKQEASDYTVSNTSSSSTSSDSSAALSEAETGQDEVNERIKLFGGTVFSDGAALIDYELGDDESKHYLGVLHTDGSIIKLDVDGKNFKTFEFDNGYAYFNYTFDGDKEGFGIVDADGNTFLSDRNTRYEIMDGGDGYYCVKKMIRTMDIAENQYGIMQADGKWLIEPQADLFGIKQSSVEIKDEEFCRIDYLGGGIFVSVYNPKWYDGLFNKILDVKKRQVTEVGKLNLIGTCDGAVIGFKDGYEGGVFRIKNDGSAEEIAEFGGYPRVMCSGNLIFIVGGSDDEIKFIDKNGKVVLDLSKYSFDVMNCYDKIKFQDGYSSVIVRGADNGSYFMIIDENGKCAFDLFAISDAGRFSDGYAYVVIPGLGTYWIDKDGNKTECTITLEDSKVGVSSLIFSDGFAYVPNKNTADCYISRTGEKLELYFQ